MSNVSRVSVNLLDSPSFVNYLDTCIFLNEQGEKVLSLSKQFNLPDLSFQLEILCVNIDRFTNCKFLRDGVNYTLQYSETDNEMILSLCEYNYKTTPVKFGVLFEIRRRRQ